MNIQVNPHRIILTKTNDVNSGEYNVNECTFEFSQEFDNLTCIAVFSLCDGTTKNITILNNKCIIPTEVLTQPGQVQIGVYGYSVEDNELVLRYSPTPQRFLVTEGSYKEGTEPVAPSPTDWEILVQQVSNNSRDISEIQEDIGNINTDIVNINTAINELDDKKANISDLSAVAFSGSYNDLIDKPNLSVYATKTDLSDEATLRENADVALQEQIDAISVSSDVVDVVGTYQELLNYDTQHLKDNDIVKVLDDSTHNDALSYYRWDKETSTWSYVGSEGPFYTKAETQELLNTKENKITTTNKLDADLVDDSNSTNKFVTESDITNWNNKEDKSNKVTSISSSSTDTQYPSAKCVYDSQEEQNEQIAELEMLYNAFPTVSAENETIQLDNTAKVKFREIDLKGNTSQVVIPEEQGTIVSNTSINVSDVNTDKEHTIEMSGNTYQETTTGKNKLSYPSNFNTTINTITFTGTDGAYSIKGGSGAATLSSQQVPYNYTIASGDYLHMMNSVVDANVGMQLYFSDNTSASPSFSSQNRIFDLSSRVGKTIVGIGLSTTSSYTGTEIKATPMIVNSSTATDYEPFTNGIAPNPTYPQNIEVVTGTNNIEVCGKNLWNNTIYQRGGSTNRCDVAAFIVEPNTTYTFSTGTSNIQIMNYYQDIDKITISNTNWVNTPYTYTTPNNCYYISMALRKSDDSSLAPSDMINVQLEKGSSATTYEPYVSQTYPINLGNIELCKIGTYKDRIYKRNDKWYLEKNIGKVVLNGSENWLLELGGLRFGYYSIVTNALSTTTSGYCTHYATFERYAQISNSYGVGTDFYRLHNDLGFETANEFKSWLSSNNITICYQLATPTTTEITDNTLVSQLNALYNSTLYSTTNINTDTSNLLPYIDLHYNFVTPSPSPSRPSVVNVVKGNNTIKIEGLNLFKDEYIGIPDVDNINAVLSAGTYTLSACDNTNFGTNIYVRLFDKNGNIITESGHMTATSGGSTINWNFSNSSYSYYGGSSFSTITFTIDNNYQLNIGLLNSSGTRKVVLVKGSEVVRTYTPYQSQTYQVNLPSGLELCKIGTYQDYIYESNGNWFKKNAIAKVVLNGSESGWGVNQSSGYYRASRYFSDIYNYTDTNRHIDKIICSHFTANINNAIGNIFQYIQQLILYVPSGITTLEQWTNWLSTHNTIVYYVLATPTDTQITDTTLITQLNNIKKAYSYDTQTNISQTNTDKPFIIYAEAIRSLKNLGE